MIVLKTLVGSRLHNLHNEETSDYDWRGIFIEPLKTILSPFKKQRSNSWIEGSDDDTSYELLHYCKLAASCNPTALEVIWSNIVIEKDKYGIADTLIKNRSKFLDTEKIYNSHVGYASNQVKKMDLLKPNDRTPKAIIAYIRTMRQGIELLETSTFNPVYEYEDRDFLLEMKYAFNESHVVEATKVMYKLRSDIEDTKKGAVKMKTDVDWIEDMLVNVYSFQHDLNAF